MSLFPSVFGNSCNLGPGYFAFGQKIYSGGDLSPGQKLDEHMDCNSQGSSLPFIKNNIDYKALVALAGDNHSHNVT